MHCSSCGKAVAHALSYCNHCGARVSGMKGRAASNLSESSLNVLLGGVVGIPIAGLVLIISLMSVMKKELGFGNEVIIAFTLLSFLLLLVAESVFAWLLIHRTRTIKETGDHVRLKDVVTKELGEAQPRRLVEPIPSVVENTTRTLEPVRRESKTH